jgi:hypothetical protein
MRRPSCALQRRQPALRSPAVDASAVALGQGGDPFVDLVGVPDLLRAELAPGRRQRRARLESRAPAERQLLRQHVGLDQLLDERRRRRQRPAREVGFDVVP